MKAVDSSDEMFEQKVEELEGDIADFLTISMKSSTSSDAIGADLSVLEYHGGFVNGVELDKSASGSSFNFLFMNK